jgi:quercetin dioxygenase-like cupin family protein
MAGLAVVAGSTAPILSGHPENVDVRSESVSVRQLSPDGVSLWLYEVALASGEMRWDTEHGDEALYVLEGAVHVCGDSAPRPVPTRGAVVVESGVAVSMRCDGPVRLLHMGPRDLSPPAAGPLGAAESRGHSVHAVGPRGIFEKCEPGRETRFYADSSCPTCRITLMLTGRSQRYVSEAHSHSQDELIHLLSGEITVGREVLGPGDTLYVAADRRYTFTSGDGGFSFLNYRRDASFHTLARGGEPVLEGGAAHGFAYVGDLR